jgi:hypothetical protein
MRAAAASKDKTRATTLRRKCKELIARAEVLKRHISVARPPGHSILDEASRLHGNDFPPWTSEPPKEEFQLKPGSEPFWCVD